MDNISKEDLAEDIKNSKCGLFATKGSIEEATAYAMSLVRGDDKQAMSIAIGVYHNTLLQALIDELTVPDED